ncbi:Gfo/Idh/MocA family protein [Sediminibacillus albus]|uniref:Predicted dehydrogenase n=1 Tax=Sediminibacillus albus TaxID=407036 RepID=A0A1G9CCU9_9BACI|nr:Gfo/Idh/MocA family oxidoreductase [Sediminibacillus albus]SDK49503.1 Predicted dehydrogenase [Sediminibacillus albus]
MSYTIGLIGCGHISQKHLDTISRLTEVTLTAVSDVQVQRMEAAANDYLRNTARTDTIKQYSDYHEMLEDSAIDIVIVAVISGLHAQIAIEALQHGKHVILEKPIALSLKEADDIIRLAETTGKQVLVCHQLRYRPLLSRIKTLLEEGLLGAPYLGVASIRINRSHDYYASAGWRGSWAMDGGMLVNQGIHLVDLLTWFFGDMESIYGEIANQGDYKETEDVASGIISFQNKAKGVIEANTITQPNNIGYHLSVFAEHGTISLGGPSLDQLDRCYIKNHPEISEELMVLAEQKDEHLYMYKNFIGALTNQKKKVLVDGREGKKALMAIFGLYKSHQSGKPVPAPLPSFSTLEMQSKNKKTGSE